MVMWEGNGDGGINTLDIYCVYLSLQKIWGPSHATFFFPQLLLLNLNKM